MLLACLRIGITINDFDNMAIGELVDILITFNNCNDEAYEQTNKTSIRQATQSDFDRF